ncbi:T9SS type A sorting domain-containing protein [Flavobacteriales bacterium]|nr:T9SS type A sorting domain-containing protein [Flavobacteriales bacterium]
MKKILLVNALVCFSVGIIFAQTTATDFTTDDCNGVSHNLFSELDAGNVIVISFVMPCGPCETYSLPAYSAVQSFATSHPGRVHFYLADDYGTTACATLNNFASNMPISTIFSSTDVIMTDYSDLGTGMPKVIVLGGSDHHIYYNENDNKINFPSVQTAISDALLAPLGIEQSVSNKFKISTYPNPVNNVLNVSYTKNQSAIINFTIVDVLGKAVLKVEDNSSSLSGNLIKSINVSTLNNGNYFLKIYSESVVESIPFVVSH